MDITFLKAKLSVSSDVNTENQLFFFSFSFVLCSVLTVISFGKTLICSLWSVCKRFDIEVTVSV